MSSWHVPGRPLHRDFAALSLTALNADAQVVEGNARAYAETATGMNMRILTARARAEAAQVISVAEEEGIDAKDGGGRFQCIMIAWATGLNAGLSHARGKSMSDGSLDAEAALLDRDSVSYMARGRITMLLDREGDRGLGELCAAAWFDGCIIGSTFDQQAREMDA